MKNLKCILAATAFTIALTLPIGTWAYDDENDDHGATITSETIHKEGVVEWLFALSNSQCRAIPSRFGVINPDSNDRVAQITRKVRPNGSRQIDVFDVVTGTAAGNGNISGNYIWIYENHAVYGVPHGAGPVEISVRMVDRFRLIGNGLSFDTSFDWRWEFQVPSGSAFDPSPEFEGLVFPDNAVHPTNVSHFKAFSTHGDPLNCDPI
jgi:hypothetical protein